MTAPASDHAQRNGNAGGASTSSGYRRFSCAVGVLVALIGFLVLLGWWVDISRLKSVGLGFGIMRANAAVAFILLGVSLALLRGPVRGRRGGYVFAQICAAGVTLIGALTLGEIIFGWDFGIDTLLFKDAQTAVGGWRPGQMAMLTAGNFVLLGAAVLLLDRADPMVAQTLMLMVGLIGYGVLLAYLYGFQSMSSLTGSTEMALNTALTFLLCSCGLLAGCTDRGPVALFTSVGFAGRMARILLPVVIVIPVLIDWLMLLGQAAGLYPHQVGTALAGIAGVIVMFFGVWWVALSVFRLEIIRKRAELARDESEECFRAITQSANDAIISADSQGLIIGWNNGATAIFGYRAEEIAGQPLTRLMPERFREAHQCGMARFLAGGEAHVIGRTVEMHGLHKDQREFPIELSISTWARGKGTFFSAIVRDITARKRAEAQQVEALRKEVFLRREIHHRVKNNLQVIISMLYLQATKVSDPATLEILRESQMRTRSIAFIYDLLCESKDFTYIVFADYLRQLTADLLKTYQVSSSTVRIVIDSDDVCLSLDAALPCGLIVNELVSNILKYGLPQRAGGTAEISIQLRPLGADSYQLVVRDNGPGWPEGFQIDAVRSLGLSLVRDFTRQLDGHVEFRNENGAVVTVSFPRPATIDEA